MTTQNKRLIAILAAIFAFLAVAATMALTGRMNWGPEDVIAAGVLLFAAGLGGEFALRLFKTAGKRAIAFGIVLFAVALVWIEIAVGIFSSPVAGN